MNPALGALIERLHLQPHPEGGYFSEHYRAPGVIATEHGPRNASTAIYYLLDGANFSRLHRLRQSDEVWHFYEGSTLEIAVLQEGNAARLQRLGPEDVYSFVVPAGAWFGARLAHPAPGAYALVGCTVAPGFDFEDFEIGRRADLLAMFPDAADMVHTFTESPT